MYMYVCISICICMCVGVSVARLVPSEARRSLRSGYVFSFGSSVLGIPSAEIVFKHVLLKTDRIRGPPFHMKFSDK